MTHEQALKKLAEDLQRIFGDAGLKKIEVVPLNMATHQEPSTQSTLSALEEIATKSPHPIIIFMDLGDTIFHGSNRAGKSPQFLADSVAAVVRNSCDECKLLVAEAVIDAIKK